MRACGLWTSREPPGLSTVPRPMGVSGLRPVRVGAGGSVVCFYAARVISKSARYLETCSEGLLDPFRGACHDDMLLRLSTIIIRVTIHLALRDWTRLRFRTDYGDWLKSIWRRHFQYPWRSFCVRRFLSSSRHGKLWIVSAPNSGRAVRDESIQVLELDL